MPDADVLFKLLSSCRNELVIILVSLIWFAGTILSKPGTNAKYDKQNQETLEKLALSVARLTETTRRMQGKILQLQQFYMGHHPEDVKIMKLNGDE